MGIWGLGSISGGRHLLATPTARFSPDKIQGGNKVLVQLILTATFFPRFDVALSKSPKFRIVLVPTLLFIYTVNKYEFMHKSQ